MLAEGPSSSRTRHSFFTVVRFCESKLPRVSQRFCRTATIACVEVAYLVISHGNPQQVLRLVRALGEGASGHVFVRHDGRHSQLDPGELEAAGGRGLRDHIDVEWGHWSYLRMLLNALERVRAELDPDWLLVLSGQDYPLRPLPEIEAQLGSAAHDAFLGSAWELETERRPGPPADDFFRRYAYRHVRAPAWMPPLPRRLSGLAYLREMPPPLRPRLGVRSPRLPFGPDLRCWVSGDWPVLSRRALAAALKAAAENRELMRHYRGSVAASESFFATVLMNDPGLSVSGDDRRFVKFAPGAARPDPLTAADLDRLVASGAHFARKFDAGVDASVLDRLDELRRSAEGR
jgi:hypothetical protein